MYLAWLFIFIGIVLVVYFFSTRNCNDTVAIIGVFCILLVSWMLPAGIGVVVSGDDEDIRVEITNKTADILCIKDNSNISGTFSLFTGSINERMYYYYYTQEPDGAISLENIYVGAAKLYEDTPQGIGYIQETRLERPKGAHTHKWFFSFHPPDQLLRREIHVPPSTVLRQFILDAE